MRTREELLQSYTSDADRLLAAKALDKLILAEKTWQVVVGDFCDPSQVHLISQLTSRAGCEASAYFAGGYAHAERLRCCFARPECPPQAEDYKLAILRVSGNFAFFRASHRDFLGALLHLGIRREKLGDVVAEDTGAYLVVDNAVAEHIRINLNQVGPVPVTVAEADHIALRAWHPQFKSSIVVAASPRLDAITAAVYNISRSEATNLVEGGLLKLNHIPCRSGSKEVKPGDLISARGLGRVYVREFLGHTQRDRLRVRIEVRVE